MNEYRPILALREQRQAVRELANEAADVSISQFHNNWSKYGNIAANYKHGYVLLNYTKVAGRKSSWTPHECVSRGLILNIRTPEVVAWPFEKFFNIGEFGMRPTGYLKMATEKVDGSLGILYWYRDKPYIATRGSFDSEQARWATAYVHEYMLGQLSDDRLKDYTLLFEIIAPQFRNVIDYGGYAGLIWLAARNRTNGEYMPRYPNMQLLTNELGLNMVSPKALNSFAEALELSGTLGPDEEGWVLETSTGERWKVKGDEYVELHKIVHQISLKRAIEAFDNDSYQEIINNGLIPEEHLWRWKFYIDYISNIYDAYIISTDILFDELMRSSNGDRKTFALLIQGDFLKRKYSSVLFAMLDKKPIRPVIMRDIKKAYKEGVLDWIEEAVAIDLDRVKGKWTQN